MPIICCIVSCSNTQKKNNVSFFRIPAVITNQGEEIKVLSEKRQKLWFAAIHRSDDNWKKTEYWRVCSSHFIKGKPSSLLDKDNPDWIPSLNLGYLTANAGIDCVSERYRRCQDRRRNRGFVGSFCEEVSEDVGEPISNLFDAGSDLESSRDEDEVRCSSVSVESLELESSLKLENEGLKRKVEKLSKALDFVRLSDISDFGNDEKVAFYTGLPSSEILMATYHLISPGITQRKNCALDSFQKFIITLMRLRLNLQIQDLSYRYGVSPSIISRAFCEIVDLLCVNLESVIQWPERDDLIISMPMAFRDKFGTKVVAVIDCFEIFIERPSNLYARAQTWSNYKHHNTVKYLIGITPQGSVSFISHGWGGRVSDKHLTQKSVFLNKLLPGDIVLADRGFEIDELVASVGASVKIPAFTRGKTQLSSKEVEDTRKIANVRIHVERVIGTVRQKYTMLESTIPINMVLTRSGKELPMLDKIVFVACALTNLCQSVVPTD